MLIPSAIALVLWALNYQKQKRTKEFLQVLQERPEVRRRKFDRLDQRMRMRKKRRWDRIVQTIQREEEPKEFHESRDYRQMQQVLHKRLDRLPHRYQYVRDRVMSQEASMMDTTREPEDILIRGHTHVVIDGDNNEYNPGGWVEEARYCILTIDYDGTVRLESCRKAPTPSS